MAASLANGQVVLCVDAHASGGNNGGCWEDAYIDLQEALDHAAASGSSVTEVWVAAGTYRPTTLTDPANPRSATFQLLSDLALYGGFAGWETQRDERDWAANKTILSGDLAEDDVTVASPDELLDEPTRAENAYHVLTGSGTDETAILDGFTITGGNANRSGSASRGGGMYNNSGSPSVTNCIFSGNFADYTGGGMYNEYHSSPTLANCMFLDNSASYGGAMYNYYVSSPTLTDCTFSQNLAYGWRGGGGMYNGHGSSPTVTNCTFRENSAKRGGGMYNDDSSPTLTNCTFSGNSAGESGGGLHNDSGSSPTLTNCTLVANSAGYQGGGMYSRHPRGLMASNCIFWANTDLSGYGTTAQMFDEFGSLTVC